MIFRKISENAEKGTVRIMRVLFMGTPDFAAECLKAVYSKDGVQVVGAVSVMYTKSKAAEQPSFEQNGKTHL